MAVIKKVFNNNAVLVEEAGNEWVLTGRGIGFERRAGDAVALEAAEKRFMHSGIGAARLAELLSTIPEGFFAVAHAVVDLIERSLKRAAHESLLLSLAEHLFHAVARREAGEALVNPLLFDIRLVYPREFALAEQALVLLENQCGVALDAHEAGFITLHIVNACAPREDLQAVMASTALVQAIRTLVMAHFPDLDEHSINFSRFMTHLLYFVLRLQGDGQDDFQDEALFLQVAKSYPQVSACVREIERLVQARGFRGLAQIEQIYLALHIQRALSSPY